MESPRSPRESRVLSADQLSRMSRINSADNIIKLSRKNSVDNMERVDRNKSAERAPRLNRIHSAGDISLSTSGKESLTMPGMLDSPGSVTTNKSEPAHRFAKLRMNGSWKHMSKSSIKDPRRILLEADSWLSSIRIASGQPHRKEAGDVGWEKLAQQQLANIEELIPKTLSSLIPDSVQTVILDPPALSKEGRSRGTPLSAARPSASEPVLAKDLAKGGQEAVETRERRKVTFKIE
mmetsp:Transcript_14023/g.48359  ORF Transcript_14023/g.48359 Transcript_14023/m.48359 type:complete len:236 (-) Transcript_14023:737-1444(-)